MTDFQIPASEATETSSGPKVFEVTARQWVREVTAFYRPYPQGREPPVCRFKAAKALGSALRRCYLSAPTE